MSHQEELPPGGTILFKSRGTLTPLGEEWFLVEWSHHRWLQGSEVAVTGLRVPIVQLRLGVDWTTTPSRALLLAFVSGPIILTFEESQLSCGVLNTLPLLDTHK